MDDDSASPRRDRRSSGVLAAFGAAVLFGIGVPIAKLLVGDVPTVLLGALLYLGAGAGLVVWEIARRARGSAPMREARLGRGDLPVLAATSLVGGVVGPMLLLFGLRHLPAVVASLLLNLEAPFTIVLAVAVFREHLGRRGAIGAALVFTGGVALSGGSPSRGDALASLALVGAALSWALDNNLMQRLSSRDPIALVRAKGLLAGSCMGAIALAAGSLPPAAATVAAALVLGAVSYGTSLVLAVFAMRALGAARQAAYFATAPFIGALAAVPLLGERMGVRELAAGAVMAVGVRLLLGEMHAHRHQHEVLEHDHRHVHDEHHQHAHGLLDVVEEPHAHPHRHAPVVHEHAHVSDLHHRHRH